MSAKIYITQHTNFKICSLLSGYYMYIETSLPRKQGDKARFISPSYKSLPSGKCFQFWYHMYGQDIGTLNVYTKTASSTRSLAWTRTGNRGNMWKIAQFTVKGTADFQVCTIVECAVGDIIPTN